MTDLSRRRLLGSLIAAPLILPRSSLMGLSFRANWGWAWAKPKQEAYAPTPTLLEVARIMEKYRMTPTRMLIGEAAGMKIARQPALLQDLLKMLAQPTMIEELRNIGSRSDDDFLIPRMDVRR